MLILNILTCKWSYTFALLSLKGEIMKQIGSIWDRNNKDWDTSLMFTNMRKTAVNMKNIFIVYFSIIVNGHTSKKLLSSLKICTVFDALCMLPLQWAPPLKLHFDLWSEKGAAFSSSGLFTTPTSLFCVEETRLVPPLPLAFVAPMD